MLHSYNSERLKNNQLTAKLNEYEGDDKRWHSFETVQAILKERDTLTAENKRLKEFARWVISEECWGSGHLDGGDIQNKAEELGLIKEHIATKEDIDPEFSDFEVGDIIYKYTDILKPKGE